MRSAKQHFRVVNEHIKRAYTPRTRVAVLSYVELQNDLGIATYEIRDVVAAYEGAGWIVRDLGWRLGTFELHAPVPPPPPPPPPENAKALL